ncbi:hypothetical protein [Peribacillus muralis]
MNENIDINIDDVTVPLVNEIAQLKLQLIVEQAKVKSLLAAANAATVSE